MGLKKKLPPKLVLERRQFFKLWVANQFAKNELSDVKELGEFMTEA